ncbi:MAG: glycosyltransferase family 1 protein [Patescibacteria group bacterium]|nr:glycosyltransferase family 1 protein [Patescibacteria group bacterium]
MFIGIDASRANKKHKTGVEWYAYHLIQNLKKIDSHNQYFLYTNKKLKGELGDCPANFQEVVLNWPPRYLWTQIRLSWAMKFSKYKPDVLFIPAHTIPILHPKNSIVTIHDVGFARFPKLYNWKDKLYHNWTLKFIKKHAKKIITVSQFSKQEIVKFYKIKPDKIQVIYNGFDAGNYQSVQDKNLIQLILEKYSITQPYFLNIARLEYKKNILGLIKSFEIFKNKFESAQNFKLILVGNRGAGADQILQAIEKSKFKKDILTLGWLDRRDLNYLMNGCRAFIFPSLYEGFGIPVLEAMSCGVPVITSRAASLPEVVADAALCVDPENYNDLAQKMYQIDTDENLRQELIKKGFQQIKKFSWQECAQRVLDVLTRD